MPLNHTTLEMIHSVAVFHAISHINTLTDIMMDHLHTHTSPALVRLMF